MIGARLSELSANRPTLLRPHCLWSNVVWCRHKLEITNARRICPTLPVLLATSGWAMVWPVLISGMLSFVLFQRA